MQVTRKGETAVIEMPMSFADQLANELLWSSRNDDEATHELEDGLRALRDRATCKNCDREIVDHGKMGAGRDWRHFADTAAKCFKSDTTAEPAAGSIEG